MRVVVGGGQVGFPWASFHEVPLWKSGVGGNKQLSVISFGKMTPLCTSLLYSGVSSELLYAGSLYLPCEMKDTPAWCHLT